MRRAAASLALLLAGCGAEPARVTRPASLAAPQVAAADAGERVVPAERGEPSEVDREIADVLARVARARHLAPRGPVTGRVLDRPALLARIREHVAREVPAEVVRGQGQLLVGLGLLPPAYDYVAGLFTLLEAQLAGFYEPSDRTMYLASDLEDDAAEATLAHELVHALQDQRWDLGPKLAYQADANDTASALQSLAEGDATSAMFDAMLEGRGTALDLPDAAFAAQTEALVAMSPDTGRVPGVLRASLLAPYLDGLRFVHERRRRGGWAAVDAAWDAPPTTTEQLLHPEKYAAHEAGERVSPLAPPGEGFRVAYEDVLGEQGARVAFEQWMARRVAARAAEGWGGDRAALFERGDGASGSPVVLAAVWRLRFDDAEQAREAATPLAASFAPGGGRPPFACAERRDVGPRGVLLDGRDVVVAAGPWRRIGGATSSAGDCRALRAWCTALVADLHRGGRK